MHCRLGSEISIHTMLRSRCCILRADLLCKGMNVQHFVVVHTVSVHEHYVIVPHCLVVKSRIIRLMCYMLMAYIMFDAN